MQMTLNITMVFANDITEGEDAGRSVDCARARTQKKALENHRLMVLKWSVDAILF